LQTSVDNVAQLRQPVAELASAISEQRNANAANLEQYQRTASETARRVAWMTDVMDRQSSVLRQLPEVESRRAAALERAFESLSCTMLQPLLAIPA
jgi:chromosome segregation ATPase